MDKELLHYGNENTVLDKMPYCGMYVETDEYWIITSDLTKVTCEACFVKRYNLLPLFGSVHYQKDEDVALRFCWDIVVLTSEPRKRSHDTSKVTCRWCITALKDEQEERNRLVRRSIPPPKKSRERNAQRVHLVWRSGNGEEQNSSSILFGPRASRG